MSRLKLKLPKLLVIPMRKRKQECSETSKGKEGWFRTRNFLSVFFQGSINNDSQDILDPSLEENHEKIDHAMKELLQEQGLQMVGRLQIAPADKKILSSGRKLLDERSVDAGKRVSFSDLFCKKIYKKSRIYFNKWRLKRTKSVKIDRGKEKDTSVATSVSVNISGKQERSKHLDRIPSRRSRSQRRKAKDVKLTLQKVMQQEEEEPENESKDVELCKKKILMGERCRPLHKSGTLQYDSNGILLPEDT